MQPEADKLSAPLNTSEEAFERKSQPGALHCRWPPTSGKLTQRWLEGGIKRTPQNHALPPDIPGMALFLRSHYAVELVLSL
jgi:hypothetical protein